MSILPEKKDTNLPDTERYGLWKALSMQGENIIYNQAISDCQQALDLAKQQLGDVEKLWAIWKECLDRKSSSELLEYNGKFLTDLFQSLAQYNLKVINGGKV